MGLTIVASELRARIPFWWIPHFCQHSFGDICFPSKANFTFRSSLDYLRVIDIHLTLLQNRSRSRSTPTSDLGLSGSPIRIFLHIDFRHLEMFESSFDRTGAARLQKKLVPQEI
jgi:hypothetical protein